MRKRGEIAVSRPQLIYAMVQAESGDARSMNLGGGLDLKKFHKIDIAFHILKHILQTHFHFMDTDTMTPKHWVYLLEEEDLAFIKRFILSSGSLKDLAEAYRVSYPTLRLRLDRLIQKIQILDDQRFEDDFERLLRAQFAEGKIEPAAFKRLLATYQKQRKTNEKTSAR